MKTISPVDHLLEIQKAAREGALVSPAAVDWLDTAVERYLVDGDRVDKAFGFNGAPGSRTARTAYLEARRNHLLREAWRFVTSEEIGPRQRSKLLAKEVRRFESGIWQRIKYHNEPPAELSELRIALFHAFRTGCRIPTTAEQLYSICEIHEGY